MMVVCKIIRDSSLSVCFSHTHCFRDRTGPFCRKKYFFGGKNAVFTARKYAKNRYRTVTDHVTFRAKIQIKSQIQTGSRDMGSPAKRIIQKKVPRRRKFPLLNTTGL